MVTPGVKLRRIVALKIARGETLNASQSRFLERQVRGGTGAVQEAFERDVERERTNIADRQAGGRFFGGRRETRSTGQQFFFNPQTGTFSTQRIAGQRGVSRAVAQAQSQGVSISRGGVVTATPRTSGQRPSGLSAQQFAKARVLTEAAQQKEFGRVVVPQQQATVTTATVGTQAAGGLTPGTRPTLQATTTPFQADQGQQSRAEFVEFQNVTGSGTSLFETPTFISGQPKTPELSFRAGFRGASLPSTVGTITRSFTEPGFLARADPRRTIQLTKDVAQQTKESAQILVDLDKQLGTTKSEEIVKGAGAFALGGAVRTGTDIGVTVGVTKGLNIAGGSIITRAGGSGTLAGKGVTLATRLAEVGATRAVLTPFFEKTTTATPEEISQFTTGVGLIQAEAFANIEGGAAFSRLGTKTPTARQFIGTRTFAGFLEGSIATDVTLGRQQVDLGVVTLGGGTGLLPSRGKEGQFQAGRIVTGVGGGAFGALTASTFAGLEFVARGSRAGRVAVQGLGYTLDPLEAPGDIATPFITSQRVFTFVPSLTPTTTTPTPVRTTGLTTTFDVTKTKVPSVAKTKTPSFTTQFTPSQVRTPTTTRTFVDVPTAVRTRTTTQVPTVTQTTVPAVTTTEVPALVDVDVPALVDVPTLTTVPAFTFTNVPTLAPAITFTPKFPVIPPALPGGGGGSSVFSGRRRGRRTTRFLPSLVGIQVKKGKIKKKGFPIAFKGDILTGLEVRGIR